jgi:hypothetical protein
LLTTSVRKRPLGKKMSPAIPSGVAMSPQSFRHLGERSVADYRCASAAMQGNHFGWSRWQVRQRF